MDQNAWQSESQARPEDHKPRAHVHLLAPGHGSDMKFRFRRRRCGRYGPTVRRLLQHHSTEQRDPFFGSSNAVLGKSSQLRALDDAVLREEDDS